MRGDLNHVELKIRKRQKTPLTKPKNQFARANKTKSGHSGHIEPLGYIHGTAAVDKKNDDRSLNSLLDSFENNQDILSRKSDQKGPVSLDAPHIDDHH